MYQKNEASASGNYSEAMEPGDHRLLSVAGVKNGANLKSHTSRGKSIIKAIFTVWLIATGMMLGLNSCEFVGNAIKSVGSSSIEKDAKKMANLLIEATEAYAYSGDDAAKKKYIECDKLMNEMRTKFGNRKLEFYKLVDKEISKRYGEVFAAEYTLRNSDVPIFVFVINFSGMYGDKWVNLMDL